jgi:protein SCO1/2
MILGRRAVMVALAMLLLAPGCARRPAFEGQVLDPPRPPLDFTLTDQLDQPVRLSALHGKVVVLTFLFTACPDVCPLITGKIHEVSDRLGKDRDKVAFVAVTVDPERDTVRALAEYSRRVAMLDRWHFLTGDQAQLTPIWTYYWVGQTRAERPGSAPGRIAYAIGHRSPIHLLDPDGQIRVIHDADFRPAAMVHDVQALLAR